MMCLRKSPPEAGRSTVCALTKLRRITPEFSSQFRQRSQFLGKLVQNDLPDGILWRTEPSLGGQKGSRMVHSRRRLLALLLIFITCVIPSSLLAGPTATLTGRVTDTTGAVIAGVKVEATNVET